MIDCQHVTPECLLILAACGIAAGFAGGLFGIGGGVVLVPLLTVVLRVDIHLAIAASLATAAAISVSSSAVYLRRGQTDLRLATLLELGGTAGALIGVTAGSLVHPQVLYLLFAGALLYAAVAMLRHHAAGEGTGNDADPDLATGRTAAGLAAALAGGTASGMLGIGGGVIYVPVLRVIMRVPLRIAIGTSALIVGLTTAAGALAYYHQGKMNAVLAGPCVLFAMLGAQVASRLSPRVSARWLNAAFVALLLYFAVRMVMEGLRHGAA
jgi:uncharacterized membrane protein YfcA